MKKLGRENKILIIFMSIAIPLIILSFIYGLPFDWGLFWGLLLFLFYIGIPLLIAEIKTEKEEEKFKKERTDFKVLIAKRLSTFKSLEILSISYSLLFGLFANIYFTIILAGYQAQAIFFSTISIGLFGLNFLISTSTLVKYHYLTNKLIYPNDIFEKFNPSEDIPEDLLRYLNLLHTPYVIKESVRYNLYLHFLTLLPFIFAIRF